MGLESVYLFQTDVFRTLSEPMIIPYLRASYKHYTLS